MSARLVRWMDSRCAAPGRTGAQHPKNFVASFVDNVR